jgi:hypothetical protein
MQTRVLDDSKTSMHIRSRHHTTPQMLTSDLSSELVNF